MKVKRGWDILDGANDKRTDPKWDNNIGYIPFAYHLVPIRGLAKIAAVMRKGERKKRNGWEKVPIEEHINHAISHLISYLGERHDDHHLANAGCRVLMALDLDKKDVLPRPGLGQFPDSYPDPVFVAGASTVCSGAELENEEEDEEPSVEPYP